MKKGLTWLFSIIAFGFLISACSKSETYSDKLKRERKDIKRFMNENGFVEVNTYPQDSIFKDNEFYKDPTSGVYINVVNKGNGKRANADDFPTVSYRYSETFLLPAAGSDTVTNDDASGRQPISFTYGRSATYTYSTNSTALAYYYLSTGVTVPLKYVGENAIVRLIVPFSQGSTYQQLYSYKAIYYGELQYTAINN